jgi:hypothetical protein
MDLSEFAANYSQLADDQLLCLWAGRNALVPEATVALDSEIQRRGLKKENAERIKKRFDTLAAREEKGPLWKQAATARYERNMRHFVGWQEPGFCSPYGSRDIRNTFAYFRHKYRVWKAFRNHTGHWPVFSIWFYFLSWMAVFAFTVAALIWVEARKWTGTWTIVAVVGCSLVLLGAQELGARLIRKLDWKRFGA